MVINNVMKFVHKLNFSGKLSKPELKQGFTRDKKIFDGIKPGEEIVVEHDEIFGKFPDGKCYVKVLTGWERFDHQS